MNCQQFNTKIQKEDFYIQIFEKPGDESFNFMNINMINKKQITQLSIRQG